MGEVVETMEDRHAPLTHLDLLELSRGIEGLTDAGYEQFRTLLADMVDVEQPEGEE